MTDWLLHLLAGDRAVAYRDVRFALDVAWPVALVLLGVVFCASVVLWHRRRPALSKALIGVRALGIDAGAVFVIGTCAGGAKIGAGHAFCACFVR